MRAGRSECYGADLVSQSRPLNTRTASAHHDEDMCKHTTHRNQISEAEDRTEQREDSAHCAAGALHLDSWTKHDHVMYT